MRDRSAYIVQCVCGKTVESHEPVITCPHCQRTIDVSQWKEHASQRDSQHDSQK